MIQFVTVVVFALSMGVTRAQVIIKMNSETPEDNTEVKQEPATVPERLKISLPYDSNPNNRVSTIGQLCKQSQLIFLGTLTNTGVLNTAEISGRPTQVLDMQVREVLLGNAPGGSVRLYQWPPLKENPSPHFSIIVFASTKRFSPAEDNVCSWKFRLASAKGSKLGSMEVVGGNRGLLIQPKGNNAIPAVRGYIAQLRQTTLPDPVGYCRFLETLLSAQDPRIRDDARVDLFLLLRFLDAAGRKTVISKLKSNNEINGYVRWLDLCEAAARARANSAPGPSEDELQRISRLLISKRQDDVLVGLGRLGDFRRWLRTSPDVLRPTLISLLEHNDKAVRFSAASFLAESKTHASIPILLEALGDISLAERTVAKSYLERAIGRRIEFEPKAAVDERTKAIAKLRKALLGPVKETTE